MSLRWQQSNLDELKKHHHIVKTNRTKIPLHQHQSHNAILHHLPPLGHGRHRSHVTVHRRSTCSERELQRNYSAGHKERVRGCQAYRIHHLQSLRQEQLDFLDAMQAAIEERANGWRWKDIMYTRRDRNLNDIGCQLGGAILG